MADDLEPEFVPGYKPPAQKSLDTIKNLDKEDESLQKYKQMLLGNNDEVPFPNDPRNVIVSKLAICPEGRSDIELSLEGELSNLKNQPIILKEGTHYRVKIYFYVQRDIVSGLKYVMATYRGPLKVDKADIMIGSYAPRKEPHVWVSDVEEAPKGMLQRGSYVVKSRFTDDDRSNYLTWEWGIKIKDNWSSSE
jgi:Rho GDP-dissociation inhibitor